MRKIVDRCEPKSKQQQDVVESVFLFSKIGLIWNRRFRAQLRTRDSDGFNE